MARNNRMTDEQFTNVMDVILESDEVIQEVLEQMFGMLTDAQLDEVLATHNLDLDIEGWDDEDD